MRKLLFVCLVVIGVFLSCKTEPDPVQYYFTATGGISVGAYEKIKPGIDNGTMSAYDAYIWCKAIPVTPPDPYFSAEYNVTRQQLESDLYKMDANVPGFKAQTLHMLDGAANVFQILLMQNNNYAYLYIEKM